MVTGNLSLPAHEGLNRDSLEPKVTEFMTHHMMIGGGMKQDWRLFSYDGSVDQVYGWYDSDSQDESWNEGWTDNTWEQSSARKSGGK